MPLALKSRPQHSGMIESLVIAGFTRLVRSTQSRLFTMGRVKECDWRRELSCQARQKARPRMV